MDLGRLNLAMKMIEEEFKLNPSQVQILSRRMLADDKEFERIWNLYKNIKGQRFDGGIDLFKEVLFELLT